MQCLREGENDGLRLDDATVTEVAPGCLCLSAKHRQTIGGAAAVRLSLCEEGGHLRLVGEVDEQLTRVECVVG